VCCCDDNPPRVYGCLHRKARKPHRCAECYRTIDRGEGYKEHSGLWDGGFDTFRWCAHCTAAYEIANQRWEAYRQESRLKGFRMEPLCFCFGALWEAIEETFRGWSKYKDPIVVRLIVGSRRRWTVKRGKRKGELMPVPSPVVAATC
jgi:hypothetical protein